MPNDLNQCNFIGRLGRDPEVRYTPSGTAVASFSLACGYKYKDTEHTEWINIVAFGKLSEIIGEYCTKGKQVFISGRLQTDQWEDKEGNKRYTTKIIADKMIMLGGASQKKQDNGEHGPETPPYPDDDIAF